MTLTLEDMEKLEELLDAATNTELYAILAKVQHELDLSEECIAEETEIRI